MSVILKKGDTKRVKDKNYGGQVSIDTRVWVYNNNTKIGKALIRNYGDGEYFLSDFDISKEHQGKGYGQAALKLLMKEYKVNSLTVLKNNDRAIHIYKKFGFKVVKTFKDIDGSKTLYMKLSNFNY